MLASLPTAAEKAHEDFVVLFGHKTTTTAFIAGVAVVISLASLGLNAWWNFKRDQRERRRLLLREPILSLLDVGDPKGAAFTLVIVNAGYQVNLLDRIFVLMENGDERQAMLRDEAVREPIPPASKVKFELSKEACLYFEEDSDCRIVGLRVVDVEGQSYYSFMHRWIEHGVAYPKHLTGRLRLVRFLNFFRTKRSRRVKEYEKHLNLIDPR